MQLIKADRAAIIKSDIFIVPIHTSYPYIVRVFLGSCTVMFAYFIGAISLFILFWNPISQTFFDGSSLPNVFPNRTIDFDESFAALDGPASLCPQHTFPAHVLSREPLIIYLPNFLSDAESTHIIDIRYVEPFSIKIIFSASPPFLFLMPSDDLSIAF